MEKSINMYEIRSCAVSELGLLIEFLKKSWSEEHIFVKNLKLLDFQHKALSDYNFVVAFHKRKKNFMGC